MAVQLAGLGGGQARDRQLFACLGWDSKRGSGASWALECRVLTASWRVLLVTLDRAQSYAEASIPFQGLIPQTRGMAVMIPPFQAPPQVQPWGMPVSSMSMWGVNGSWDLGGLWNTAVPGASAASGAAYSHNIVPMEGAGRMARGGGLVDTATAAADPLLQHGFPQFSGGHGHYISGSQPTPGKRPILEINHNKAITKKLASAVHYQQVLDCVSGSVQFFDEVNVATALHRLAKLQPPSPSGQPSPVIYAEQFQQLVLAIRRLLPRFEAQAVSNTMWAFATLSYFPEDNLLEDLANHAVSIMSTFRPQATSNTLWAFAKLSYCPCEALLRASAQRMVQDLPKSVPQDISNTLWAFATLRHYPGVELMRGAASQAILTMQRFKPQEIANTLWSFATLGHDPETPLLDAMAIQMVAKIQQFRPQAVSNSLWAYARCGYNPGKLLMEVAAQKAAGMLHQYTSQEVANTLWALASLEHHPGAHMLDAAAVQIARRIEQFSPQDTTNSIWSFAKFAHQPCQDLLQGVALYTLRHWHRFKAQEAVNVLGSLAVLKACTADTWQLLLGKLSSLPLTSFEEADLHQLYQTHLLLEAAASFSRLPSLAAWFPQTLLESAEKVWRTSVRKTGRISRLHEEVSRVLWGLSIVHHNEHVIPDGLFCVDIALDDTSVVIDVQGPSQFSVNNHLPLGRTIAKRIMLEAHGLTVVSIPYFEWNGCRTPDQQKAYLSRLLASAHTLKPSFAPAAVLPVTLPSSLPLQQQLSSPFPASLPLPASLAPPVSQSSILSTFPF